MVPYYILACSFGAFATVLFLIGHKRPDFPGRYYGPVMLVAAVFAVSTMTAVIVGAAGHEEGNDAAAADHEESAQ